MQVRQQRDIWWIQASTKTKLQLNNYWIFQIVSKPILTQRSIQMLAVYCVIKMTKLCMDFNPIYPRPVSSGGHICPHYVSRGLVWLGFQLFLGMTCMGVIYHIEK